MRRAPRQSRSQERISAILDAAIALFVEVGYEATTTNAIAARAGANIGSLYHFFPNKEAILAALAARFMGAYGEKYDGLFSVEELQTLSTQRIVERLIDNAAAFEHSHDGFMELLYGSQAPDSLRAVSEQIHQSMVSRVEGMLALRFAAIEPKTRQRMAELMVGATKVGLAQAKRDPENSAESLNEVKAMLSAYLNTFE